MHIKGTDQSPTQQPVTTLVTLTMTPQLALDVATAMILAEFDEADPFVDLVRISVALCDVVYDTHVAIEDTVTTWAVESTISQATATHASLPDPRYAELRELARRRLDGADGDQSGAVAQPTR